MGDSYYELLGVSADATTDEIEQAYRDRLKETHPDVSDDEDASERTKQLIEARDTLTDEHERARYDRLGHTTYISDGRPSVETTRARANSTTSTDSAGNTHTQGESTRTTEGTREPNAGDGAGSRTGPTERERRRERRRQQRRKQRGRADQWSNGTETDAEQWEDSWRAWDTDSSYAVRRGNEGVRGSGVISAKQSLLVFAATVAGYPVLLFGALHGPFPLPANIVVAMCAVLVVAFLQSVPLVGVGVFGFWTLLLPPLLVFQFGVSLLSPVGLLATIAVIFPFGLSLLTWRLMEL